MASAPPPYPPDGIDAAGTDDARADPDRTSAASAGPDVAATVEARLARVVLRHPGRWRNEPTDGVDARIVGDAVTVSVRSRPSDNAIAAESRALLERLPGAVDGVLVVGCDPWTAAGAPARLVEYSRPGEDGPVFASHLLLATGRHRVEVVAERPLAALAATDDAVFAVLESVRALEHVRGVDVRREAFPDLPVPSVAVGPRIEADAFAVLRGLAGRRWNPATLRAPGAKQLVDEGLVGRFGTLPPATATLLAPWAAAAEPVTLEQRDDDGTSGRLQVCGEDGTDALTVVDGVDETGYAVGTLATPTAVTLFAERLGVRPSWTWAFRTPTQPEALLAARLRGERPDLDVDDPVLHAFWSAAWTVSHLRGRSTSATTFVHAHGVGHARVGRTRDGRTAFRPEAPANVFRAVVRALHA